MFRSYRGGLGRRRARIPGGSSHWLFSLAFPPSSFIRHGRLSRANNYWFGPYISPMYSPELFGSRRRPGSAGKPAWFPAFLPFSAAMLILWAPGGFRFTCYYYRGAYYKAFWADPPNCAVGEPRKTYLGRAHISADHSEHPSLLHVYRGDLHRAAGERRVGRLRQLARWLPRQRRLAGAR